MSSDVWTYVASGEPKMKTMCEIIYKMVTGKKCREGLCIYWRDNTR